VTYLIAEAGLAHDGSMFQARQMIDVFARAGATAIKFQGHRGQEVTGAHPSEHVSETRAGYYARTGFDVGEWIHLHQRCAERGVDFVLSPFSVAAVEEAEALYPPARWKIASGQVTDLDMLRAVAATGRPVLVSTGMSTAAEDARALAVLGQDRCGREPGVLLCVSKYPCEATDLPLLDLTTGAYVGLSDHTVGATAAIAATALGAEVIEKHVTLSRHMYGSDSWMSMLPDEFTAMAGAIRDVGAMMRVSRDKGVRGMAAVRKVYLAS